MAALRDRNTLFVLFGDHGEAFGQHEGNFGHTLFIYDENVRVPYVIAAPGLTEDKIRISNAVLMSTNIPCIHQPVSNRSSVFPFLEA